jgi:hypothetical protein
MKIRLLDGKVVDAEIVEMNCAKIEQDGEVKCRAFYLPPYEFYVLPDTEDLKTEIRTVIEQQGWNDATVGILAGEFIAENNLGEQFLKFLREWAVVVDRPHNGQ